MSNRDFYAWTQQQADALRRRARNEIDWDEVAEEIEALGRSEKREIGSRLAVLLQHLLKWRYQSEQRSGSWRASILEARDGIADLLEDNPSLHEHPGQQLAKAYKTARRRALDETGLLNLPEACPWTIEQVLDLNFFP